ncbi:unnamed protein product, partial [Acanthoscelides obtectus]
GGPSAEASLLRRLSSLCSFRILGAERTRRTGRRQNQRWQPPPLKPKPVLAPAPLHVSPAANHSRRLPPSTVHRGPPPAPRPNVSAPHPLRAPRDHQSKGTSASGPIPPVIIVNISCRIN